jgi:hypothetical protein
MWHNVMKGGGQIENLFERLKNETLLIDDK